MTPLGFIECIHPGELCVDSRLVNAGLTLGFKTVNSKNNATCRALFIGLIFKGNGDFLKILDAVSLYPEGCRSVS